VELELRGESYFKEANNVGAQEAKAPEEFASLFSRG
jgi:hypothetical protein